MIIGNFTFSKDDNQYAGSIQTLSRLQEDVLIQPVAKKASERSPDYRVVVPNPHGIVELGAAWKKKSGAGKEYLSVRLEDPAKRRPCFAALLTSDQGSHAILVWSRPLKKGRQAN
jgi:uncharacterized protein (DUF736 family)